MRVIPYFSFFFCANFAVDSAGRNKVDKRFVNALLRNYNIHVKPDDFFLFCNEMKSIINLAYNKY